MLTDAEIERLRFDLESDLVERKSSASDGDKIRQAICAYANDLPDHRRPGLLLVGIQDDGRCANLKITDKLLKDLAGMRDEGNIQPFPTMAVRKVTFEDGCVAVAIVVAPSDRPPFRLDGRVWIRVGPRRAVASAEEERRLTEKRRAGDRPFDLTPVPGATLADLDLDLFRSTYLPGAIDAETLAANKRPVEWQLASLRLVTPNNFVPTVCGMLVLGKDPQLALPGAYVQFLRLDGTELTDPIKAQVDLDGRLHEVLNTVDAVLKAHVSVATDITGGSLEVRRPDFPVVALQQLLRNAVMHRQYEGTNAPVRFSWFSDRIEILSPGGPFGQVTVANFGQPGMTDYRNPHLAEAMKALGYVQRFGVGIQLARSELAKNENPALDFTVEPTHVLATLRRRRA